MNKRDIQNEVWQTILEMDKLWTVANKAEELVYYFHKNMVTITPSNSFRREGQAACVEGWKGFADMAKINYWKEMYPRVDVYRNGLFAIVTYRFEMSFEINAQTIEMSGRDLNAFIKDIQSLQLKDMIVEVI